MSSHEPSRTTPGIPLPALVAELRSRCEAASRLQGGSTYYQEELGIFRSLAEEESLYLGSPPPELSNTPDEEGNEHQVWYPKDSRLVVKATWPDFFGMLVVHRSDEEPMAPPIAYLERWCLHNQLFGDEVRFVAALQTETGLRLLISQLAIAGEPATEAQIHQFFEKSGWLRFTTNDETAYFNPKHQVVVSDTHRANLILMADGQIAPIDLRVQKVTTAILETIRKLTLYYR